MLLVSYRVLSNGPCSTVTHDKGTDEETCQLQTYARLKALLQFYQESEVITPVVISWFQLGGWHVFTYNHANVLVVFFLIVKLKHVLPYVFFSSCTNMWCTWWIVCGTVVELFWRTGRHSHQYCCKILYTAQVGVMSVWRKILKGLQLQRVISSWW